MLNGGFTETSLTPLYQNNMGKLFMQLMMMVMTFLVMWWGLSKIDWMTTLHVEEVGKSTEEKLGKLYWEIFKKMEDEETDEKIMDPVDSLLTHLCEQNGIDHDKIKLHIIRKDDINAFALPDGHLVLFTGLIEDCENEAELCGVMAHELAHMQNGHIMKKLVKEIGLSMLISMTTGKGNPEMIQQAVKVLSSTAYDRSLESDADITGVDYLINAHIDPEPFANFLFRMSAGEKDLPQQLFWITTHPGAEDRTRTILDYVGQREYQKQMVLDSVQWIDLKQAIL